MRISPAQKNLLVELISSMRPESKIYLFGSRVDDDKRGGDIDILIIDKRQLDLEERSLITRTFWTKFGEQKVDLVCFSPDSQHPFKKMAMIEAHKLYDRADST